MNFIFIHSLLTISIFDEKATMGKILSNQLLKLRWVLVPFSVKVGPNLSNTVFGLEAFFIKIKNKKQPVSVLQLSFHPVLNIFVQCNYLYFRSNCRGLSGIGRVCFSSQENFLEMREEVNVYHAFTI